MKTRYRLLALIGLAVLLLMGIGLSISYVLATRSIEDLAVSLDEDRIVAAASPTCGGIESTPDIPRRVLSENESGSLTISVRNSTEDVCEVEVRVFAARFDLIPSDTVQSATLQPDESAEITWIIIPRATGTQSIVVTVGNRSYGLYISVTDVLGLSPQLRAIFQIIGYFFGPALTFPWLYTQWKEWKERQADKQRAAQPA
jgi:hypothetical protein